MQQQAKPTGLTKDGSWQFGLRKTFPISQKQAWDFVVSEKGLNIWLGALTGALEIKKPFRTKDGIEGLLRVLTPYSHIRMSWKKKDWENTSAIQVRVIGDQKKATISFHHDRLMDGTQRKEAEEYWTEKMVQIAAAIAR